MNYTEKDPSQTLLDNSTPSANNELFAITPNCTINTLLIQGDQRDIWVDK